MDFLPSPEDVLIDLREREKHWCERDVDQVTGEADLVVYGTTLQASEPPVQGQCDSF